MIDPLNSQFEVNDRGGEYYTKLRTMHTRINQLISEFNALAGDHATAAQGQLAETAYADRFKWDGSPAALANPAAGRASLQLGSSATRPASDFATYHQGSLAEEAHTDRFKWNGSAEGLNAAVGRVSLGLGSAATQSATNFATAAQGVLAQTAIQPGHFSIVGANLAELPTPSDTRYLQFHSGGGVSMLTAVQFLAAIGASSGMANPMTSEGDLIIGGVGGAPTRLPAHSGNGVLLAANQGAVNYFIQGSDVFDFGRWARGRRTTAIVSSISDFNIDLEGGIHVGAGADYWISPTVNQGTHPVWEGFDVTEYRLQDFRIGGSTGSTNSTRYQLAIPNISSVEARDNAYLQIRFKQSGTSSSETWGPWRPVGAGSSGGDSHRYAPVLNATSAMQVSNNINIELDASEFNFFFINGWPSAVTAENPNSGGSYNIDITGLVSGSEKVVSGHIHTLRLGRKPAVNITASGYTVNWIAVPTFKNTATGTDLIHYYVSPLRPDVLNLSLIDTRA